jgi:hypothetical protein
MIVSRLYSDIDLKFLKVKFYSTNFIRYYELLFQSVYRNRLCYSHLWRLVKGSCV